MHPLLFGIFGGFLIGAGLTAEFERAAAREIKSRLQGEAKLKVRTRASFGVVFGELVAVRIEASDFRTDGLPLFTEPERSKAGKIGRLEMSFQNFYLRGLEVKKLEATIPRCRYDRTLALTKKKFRLTESGEGLGRVEVEAGALERFAIGKYREIKDVHITLENDRCVVEGEGEFLIIRTHFRAEGKLVSPDGTRIELSDATISFDGKPADPVSSDAVLRTLNPIVDLNKDLGLYGAVKVTKIRLVEGLLLAEGKTHIPNHPLHETIEALTDALNHRVPEAKATRQERKPRASDKFRVRF